MTDLAIVAVTLCALSGVLFFMTRAHRILRRTIIKPSVEIEIEEPAVGAPELAPWSPTRGNYWFDGSTFPSEYFVVPNVPRGSIKQFGDSEDDARSRMATRLALLVVKETGSLPPPITSPATSFRPLTIRKRDRKP